MFPPEKNPAARSRVRKTTFVNESKTIAEGLGKYGIGAKLRRLRLRKSMGLLELGKHTGLSSALLSKLERDVMHPTLPTLLRIAMVFSVDLDYFFVPEPKPVLEIDLRTRHRISRHGHFVLYRPRPPLHRLHTHDQFEGKADKLRCGASGGRRAGDSGVGQGSGCGGAREDV